MMEVYMTDAGDQQMKVQLRALDESLAESGRLHKLTELAAIDPGKLYLFAAATTSNINNNNNNNNNKIDDNNNNNNNNINNNNTNITNNEKVCLASRHQVRAIKVCCASLLPLLIVNSWHTSCAS